MYEGGKKIEQVGTRQKGKEQKEPQGEIEISEIFDEIATEKIKKALEGTGKKVVGEIGDIKTGDLVIEDKIARRVLEMSKEELLKFSPQAQVQALEGIRYALKLLGEYRLVKKVWRNEWKNKKFLEKIINEVDKGIALAKKIYETRGEKEMIKFLEKREESINDAWRKGDLNYLRDLLLNFVPASFEALFQDEKEKLEKAEKSGERRRQTIENAINEILGPGQVKEILNKLQKEISAAAIDTWEKISGKETGKNSRVTPPPYTLDD